MSQRIARFPALLLALLFIVAVGLTWTNFTVALPRTQWQQALWSPDIDVIEQMIFHYSLLPRLVISLLVGAGLGLVGVLFQQVLRNPLAEPCCRPSLSSEKGGFSMTEKEYKEHIQYTHNAYCRIVIRHASIDAARMLFAKWKREISLEYLTEEKFVPLSTTDEYFQVKI